MTIIIYFTEDKKNYQIIHPKDWSKNPKENFDGYVGKLIEHLTHSDFNLGIRNYYSFKVL